MDMGNTVVVIEHNLDVIKMADRIIDLGPGGRRARRQIVAVGTPEQVARTNASATGQACGEYLVRKTVSSVQSSWEAVL